MPSVTEALFALGLGPQVVGVTQWCVHPAQGVEPLPKVGGTKNPELESILSLEPDLVIANREENKRQDVDRLRDAGIEVWVTYPRTVAEGVQLLAELADLGADAEARQRVVMPAVAALAGARERAADPPVRVFCPIWRNPWMTINRDTYIHDMIELCGGDNVFGERTERRYPIVRVQEIQLIRPEVILLPDEPYSFAHEDARELMALDIPAARDQRIHLIDGTLLSWYGPRIPRGILLLQSLFDSAGGR